MRKILLLLSLLLIIIACSGGESSDTTGDNYNRTNLLTNWSDNIIIPSFENYQTKVGTLKSKVESFNSAPTTAALTEVRNAWLDAYKAFQHVALYDIGKAEEISFVSFSNIYPTYVFEIENNITYGGYDLASLTQIDKQGFPAVDYMINGLGADDDAIVAFYTSNAKAAKYKQYLLDLVTRLKGMADLITNDWKNTYRNTFVASNGNSVSSSVNKIVNAIVKNYEKNVRAGKVGIPAGIYSSGVTYSNKVEAYYKNDISKLLLNEGIIATQNFFNGKHFNSSTTGAGLKEYLDHLNVVKDGQKLSDIINAKFATIFTTTAQLNDSFSEQIISDNSKMISAFDQLQWIVIYFKTDMMPALNITVDYVDADGD